MLALGVGQPDIVRPGMKMGATTARLQRSLLDWYDRHRRILPWRAARGATADPYHVWLSEIMLQQTTVVTVGPYFQDFIARWPSVMDLAAASLDDVLHAWQGLGYYARARNLHKCAQVVAADLGGKFPEDEADLRALPGIGAYTAAAIAAIAFARPATVVDGNVERVIARLRRVETPLPPAKPELTRLAAELTPARRPGDYAQAIMDLGATVCMPRNPACDRCPWHADCAARAAGVADELPRKLPKKERPTRRGVAFWTVRRDGSVLLRRRPESGLLGGMMECAVDRMARAGVDRHIRRRSCAAAGRVAGARRPCAPYVHAFSPRAYRHVGQRPRRYRRRCVVPDRPAGRVRAADRDEKGRPSRAVQGRRVRRTVAMPLLAWTPARRPRR